VGLAGVVIGLLFIRFRKFMTLGAISGYGPLPRWFDRTWIAIVSIFTVFASITTLADYFLLRSGASRGKLDIAEGIVDHVQQWVRGQSL
jgi:hypothetical protein